MATAEIPALPPASQTDRARAGPLEAGSLLGIERWQQGATSLVRSRPLLAAPGHLAFLLEAAPGRSGRIWPVLAASGRLAVSTAS